MQVYFKHFLANEAAGVSLEYALLIGLIGLTVIPGSLLLSSKITNQFNSITTALNKIGNPGSGFMPVRKPSSNDTAPLKKDEDISFVVLSKDVRLKFSLTLFYFNPNTRIAFCLRMRSCTSGLKPAALNCSIQRSGVINGKSEPNSILVFKGPLA